MTTRDHPPTAANATAPGRIIARWSYLALALALLWLAAAAVSFSHPSPPVLPFLALTLTGLAIAIDATARLATIIITQRRSPRTLPGPLLRWLPAPAVGVLGLALLATDADLKLRIALADAAMRAEAQAALTAATDAQARQTIGPRLGLFPAKHIQRRQQSLRIQTTNTGVFSTAGLYYAPNGMNTGTTTTPNAESEYIRHIKGPWYAFQWSD